VTNNIVSGNAGCAVSAYHSPQVVLQGNQITGQTSQAISLVCSSSIADTRMNPRPRAKLSVLGFPHFFSTGAEMYPSLGTSLRTTNRSGYMDHEWWITCNLLYRSKDHLYFQYGQVRRENR
jgi:hypothetical protein